MKTSASLFTGGGLFDIGAEQAGYKHVWGVEYDDKIASVARLNGFNVVTADVRNVDFTTLERPNHLNASPPCPNFSVAKTDRGETETDIQLSDAVCRAITILRPDTFTLDNVVAYRKSESLKRILDTLHSEGYMTDIQNLNAADFGVPQTRRRMILRAAKSLLRPYPQPVKWVGWYSAIEDLIDTLPETEFAPWQIARLPKEYNEFLIGQGNYSKPVAPKKPSNSITANSNQIGMKAFIMSSGNNSFADAGEGKGVRYEDEPVHTMMVGKTDGKIKAFILDGQPNNNGASVTIRDGDTPTFTQTATAEHRPQRAFDGKGKVVKMTVKALGRFQTVPDWYKGLTVKINGNGVPCLMAQKIMESLSE